MSHFMKRKEEFRGPFLNMSKFSLIVSVERNVKVLVRELV